MSARTACWLLFIVFALTIPLPLLGPLSALAPAARYLVLASVTASVAVVEGASGPVPLIFLLFAIHAVVYLGLEWLFAWLIARGLSTLSPGSRSGLVIVACGTLLIGSIVLDLYRTPFGTLPRSNLLGLFS
ncbi:MAG: hypothetical protein VX252_06015 [Myxococcota bacterium]|nr:hypothetical protein [Myxococcota bacterium]